MIIMENRGVILSVVLLLAAAAAFFFFSAKGAERPRAITGAPAPQFELRDMQGGKISLQDLRGKVVLVNFWATWCETCGQEAPLLQRLADDEKFRAGLEVVKILCRDTRGNAAHYIEKNNFRFIVVMDDKQTSLDYGITGVPESFIISKKGILKYKLVGPVRWDSQDIRALISDMIAEE